MRIESVAHYQVIEKLGEGGMGEVYRARDTKLNRDVALKILPQVFAQDSERMARFEREAQVLASLNHTNIAQIYGLEEMVSGPETRDSRHSKTKALVLELVPGETLQEQIARGPIPVDEALKIALQICEGLEAAHEKGIIHRDLKPANIKITPEGQVKILDFGLAKALEGETPVGDLSHSPTLTHQSTQAGVILGTAAYMSPEQARGDRADRRSDIWSFGALLFEMLVGQKSFDGSSVADVLASVLKVDPDWSLIPVAVPKDLTDLLRRCLTRDPRERLQAIGEARVTIHRVLHKPQIERATDSGDSLIRRRSFRWLIAVLMFISVVASWWFFRDRTGSLERREGRILMPVQLTSNPLERSVIGAAISPVGNYLAYVDPKGLHLQVLSTGESSLVDMDEPLFPDTVWWYPDETRLLLLARRAEGNLSLWVVGMLGGRVQQIQENVQTAAISPDGLKLAFIRGTSPSDQMTREIWLADADGQNPHLLLNAGENESFWHLAWTPNSQRLGYGVYSSSSEDEMVFLKTCDLEGKNVTLLLSGYELFQSWTGSLPFLWTPDGRLIFAKREHLGEGWDPQTSNLWIVETDPAAGITTGEPHRLTQWVTSNVRGLSISKDGTRLAPLLVRNQADLFWGQLDSAGKSLTAEKRLTFNEKSDEKPSWRPDGKALVYMSSRGGTSDLYTQNLESDEAKLLLSTPAFEWQPHYTPDGKWILYLAKGRLYRIPANGGTPQMVLERGYASIDCVDEKNDEIECIGGFLENNRYVFHSLDLDNLEAREILRISHRAPFTNWALNRDGTKIAVVHMDDNTVRIFSLPSGEESVIEVKGWSNFEYVSWSSDGKRIYLNSGVVTGLDLPSLISIDLDGNAELLRKKYAEWHVHQKVSPDGNYLAFVSMPFHGNAWMITDF